MMPRSDSHIGRSAGAASRPLPAPVRRSGSRVAGCRALRLAVLGLSGLAGMILWGCERAEQRALPGEGARPGLERVFQQGSLKVVASVDNPEPSIAERITLVLEVTHDERDEVVVPAVGENLGEFTVSDSRTTQPELLGDRLVRQEHLYILEPNLTGELRIPPLTVRTRGADGASGEELEVVTDELVVTVRSVLSKDAADLDIRDIAPPVDLPAPVAWWVWPAVIGGGLVLLGLVAWLLRRSRRTTDAAPPRRPAHEVALAALEELVADDLPGRGEIKPYYQRISDILRHYIEDRFGLHAPDRTTEEFLGELERGSALDAAHRLLLARFLRQCDLVKFAELQPAGEDIRETYDACRNFVLETKVEAVPEAAS